MDHQRFLARLAQPSSSRIVLLVLDGVGDVATAAQPQTALAKAVTPNLDRLARQSALGRLDPVTTGITPGLTPGAKLIIMAAMFAGRVGPLTILLALTTRLRPADYRYPTEHVIIG